MDSNIPQPCSVCGCSDKCDCECCNVEALYNVSPGWGGDDQPFPSAGNFPKHTNRSISSMYNYEDNLPGPWAEIKAVEVNGVLVPLRTPIKL